jgi:hypothetical protein
MRKGPPWLKTTLIQCGWAATRKKGSYIQAQYHRICSRRGKKKAIGAVAAYCLTPSILPSDAPMRAKRGTFQEAQLYMVR